MPDLASLFVFPFFLILIRVGTAVMIFPGLADPSVNRRARLLIALVVTGVMFPFLAPNMPALPSLTGTLFLYMFYEFVIGLLMGIGARLFMSALGLAGELIAFSSGFQAATLFDPLTGTNTTAPTLFLLVTAGVLVFAMNLHHVLIEGLLQSYEYFPAGTFPPLKDSVHAVMLVVSHLFEVGVKLAAPVMAVGFLSYLAFGIFNRLIPQLHVFFVALPISITLGIFILMVAFTMILTLFMTEIQNHAIIFMIEGE